MIGSPKQALRVQLLAASPWLAWMAAVACSVFVDTSVFAAGDYVGDQVCAGCHADAIEPYSHTIHAKVFTEANAPNALARLGCEACHGPGQAHVEAGGGRGQGGEGWVAFGSDDRAQIQVENGVCLQCHDGGEQRYWTGSPHQSRGNSCGSCHDVMKKVSDDHLLAKVNQTETCSSCHLIPRSQQMRISHMPVRQGPAGAGGENFLRCGSCHNPHGSVTEKLIAANSVNENCYGCHAEKRGPYLWEHAPVNENCLNCHNPHGSIKPKMLKIAPPRLCQTCHVESLHPSQTRDANDRMVVGRQCMQCHTRIHGSNHPSGSFFTR